MKRTLRRTFLATTSGIALATAVGILVASPARALPPECVQVGLSVTCTGLVSDTVYLDSHLNLVNNGIAPFGVYAEAFTTTTNNNTISIASTSEAASYTENSQFYAEIHESNTAFGLGYKSTLNNLGTVSAAAAVSATVVDNYASGNEVDMTAKAVGVYNEYQSFLNNSGPISATATNSLTMTDVGIGEGNTSVIGYSAAYGVYGDEGASTVTNNAAGVISATATYTVGLTNVGNTTFDGISAFAAGIALADSYTDEDTFNGSVITNKGTVNATATMNFTVSGAEGSYFTFYGPHGDFNAPTVTAFGILADFGSTIVNTGTVNATATANFSLTNVTESYIGYQNICCDENYQSPMANAVGIMIGPETKPAPWYTPFHYYGNPDLSVDTVTNSGPINATATFNLTVTDSLYISADVGARAAGIVVAYPSYYCCGGSDFEGWVAGTAMVTNSGPLNVIAATNVTVQTTASEAFGPSIGENEYSLYSYSTGIDVTTIGGSEGGVRTTVNNSGPINATATSTFKFTGIDVGYGSNDIYLSANATGIHADGFSTPCCEGPYFDFGPSVTNSGVLTVLATAQATINYSNTIAFGGGEIDNYVNVYAEATGIDAHWDGAQINNTGAITAIAQSLLTINVTNANPESYARVNFDVGCCSMDAYAYGILPGYGSTVNNTAALNVTALSQLTVTANASNVDAYSNYVTMNAYAMGIGDDESSLTIDNSGNIKVIAKVAVNVLGSFYANSVSMYAESYGINAGEDSHVLNTGNIQASSIASFTLDVGLGNGSMFAANSNYFYMSSDAVGIGVGDDSFVHNTATLLVTAATDFTGLGLVGMEGGYSSSLYAYATGIGGAEGNTLINDGTLNVIASVTVNTPGYIYYGYTSAKAYGIDAGYDNVITNNGIINVIASVNFTGDYLDGEAKIKAYGIKVDSNNTILNTGTIKVLAGLTINGVTQDQFATGWDPAKSYGIYAKFGNYITNSGLIENTRIGPDHWAVYLKGYYDCCYGQSQFTNTGTTIGSIYLGSNNGQVVNTGTMVFRVQPPAADSLGIASYGTYDRIVMKSNTSFDTANGTILIRPLGNPTAYTDTTIYPYFVRGNNGDGVTPIIGNGSTLTGLTPGQPVQLKTDSAFFIPSLQTTPTDATWYDSKDGMDLIMTRVAFNTPLGVNDLPGNQGTSGDGLEKAFQELIKNNSNPNSAFGAFLGSIQQLPPGQVPGAYQQLAGEITSNMSNVGQNTASQLFGALFGSIGQFASSQGPGAQNPGQNYASKTVQYASLDVAQATPGVPSSATTTPGTGRWMAWISGYGQTGQVDSQPGISGVTYNVAGAMTGIEYALSNVFRVGLALGGGASWASLDDIDGSAKSKFFQTALYGSYTMGMWYVDGALGYGRHWVDTDRTVGIPGFADKLKGDFDANQFIAGVETGYRFQFDRFALIPFAGMQVSVFSQDAYTETGGPAALHFNSDTSTSARGILGAYVRTSFKIGENITFNPFAKLAWAHEFGDQSATVSANFVAAPSSSFNVYGAERSRDALIVGVGFEMNIGTMYNVYASYNGDITARGSAHAGTGGLKIRW